MLRGMSEWEQLGSCASLPGNLSESTMSNQGYISLWRYDVISDNLFVKHQLPMSSSPDRFVDGCHTIHNTSGILEFIVHETTLRLVSLFKESNWKTFSYVRFRRPVT